MRITVLKSLHVTCLCGLAMLLLAPEARAALNIGLRPTVTPITVGQTSTWMADSWQPDFSPLQYRFTLTSADGTVVSTRSFGSDNCFEWIPYEPGTYALKAVARNTQTGETEQ